MSILKKSHFCGYGTDPGGRPERDAGSGGGDSTGEWGLYCNDSFS